MSLILLHERLPVAECFFTLCAWGGRAQILVGCLQGPRPGEGEGRLRVHTATLDLDHWRPREFLMAQLRALAALLGAEGIYLAGQDARVNRGGHSDYDAVWAGLGARACGRSHYHWPAGLYQPRDPATLPAQKRAQYRRRRELIAYSGQNDR